MVMKALRKGASGGISKFLLFGFLIMAVGGLVMMDVGGFFRGGVARTDVARAGGETIPITSFDRSVRMTLQRIGMTPQEAYRLGYIDQILNAEIRGRLLNQAAAETGIMIDKKHVARQIKDIITPMTSSGQSPEEILRQILLNQGMSEQAFVANMSRDMANTLLSAALQGGLQGVSQDIAADLYKYQNEKRSVEYISFPDSDLKDIPEPPEEQLRQLYEATKESYAQNEMRTFKLITVNTDNIKSTIEIADEEIRNAYDDNIDLYTVNAQRTLDQALLNSEEQAQAVKSAAEKGKSLKDAVNEVTSGTTAYLGEQSFEEKALLEEIKDEVLAVQNTDEIIGPIQTPLGWYVIKVVKISPAKTKSFDEVKSEIKNEMIENQIIDQQFALANSVDDLLASGAALDDVAKEVDLDIQPLPPLNQFGQNKDGKDALKDFEKSRDIVLEAGFALEEGETSPVLETAEGRFQAVHLESLTPKTYTPFEEVRKEILDRWMKDQARLTNQMRVAQILAGMAGEPMTAIAKAHSKKIQNAGDISRMEEPKAPFNERSIGSIFEAPINLPVAVDIEGGFAIALVKDFKWPEEITAENKDFASLRENIEKASRDEGLMLYLEQKRQDHGATVNKSLLDQVYGPEAVVN